MLAASGPEEGGQARARPALLRPWGALARAGGSGWGRPAALGDRNPPPPLPPGSSRAPDTRRPFPGAPDPFQRVCRGRAAPACACPPRPPPGPQAAGGGSWAFRGETPTPRPLGLPGEEGGGGVRGAWQLMERVWPSDGRAAPHAVSAESRWTAAPWAVPLLWGLGWPAQPQTLPPGESGGGGEAPLPCQKPHWEPFVLQHLSPVAQSGDLSHLV